MFSPWLIGGAALTVGVLSLTSYAMYQRSEAADARADSAVALQKQFQQDLAESEADKALMRLRGKELDAIVRERDSRVSNLQAENQSRDEAYEKLRAEADAKDQECLSRALPPAIAERLRH